MMQEGAGKRLPLWPPRAHHGEKLGCLSEDGSVARPPQPLSGGPDVWVRLPWAIQSQQSQQRPEGPPSQLTEQ